MSDQLMLSRRRTGQPTRIRPYGLADVAHRKQFDDLTNLAVTLTHMPVAFIAVVEAGQWRLRSLCGLGPNCIKDLAPMCQYAGEQSDLTMVSRSRDQAGPVAGFWPVDLEMKFVALVPLLGGGGQAAGCLGVMDEVERRLTTPQQDALWALSRQAETQIELRRSLTTLARATAAQARAEQALANERNLLRAVINSVPDNLYLKDCEGRYILDNDAHLRFLGAASPDEVLGKTAFDFFPPEQAQQFSADDQNVLSWGQALFNIEEVAVDRAGMRHDMLTSKIPFFDDQFNVQGLICISHDITTRKQGEVAIAQLAAIVENSSDAIYSTGLNGMIRSWNAAAGRLLGYSASEIVGRSISTLVPPEQAEESARIQQRVAHGWRLPTFETEFVRKDGFRVEVSVTVSPLQNAAGTVIGASVMARDITERRRKTRDLESLNRRLSETLRELHRTQHELVQTERLRALGQMASGIAHDFNNALSPITGFSELLLARPADAADPRKLKRYLEMIRERAGEAAQIVAQLRDFYRFRDNAETVGTADLNHIVEAALELIRPKVAAARPAIHLETSLAPLPAIAAVAAEVREAVTHLAANAIEALGRKGQRGTLRLATRVYGDHVILEVVDTGSGMNEATRLRCLEPFFTTKSDHGSGLGLAMVYGMISRHNGLIHIDSTEGEGTTVCLCFPIPTTLRDSHGAAGEANPPQRTVRMLIVDDEPDIREVTAEFLKDDGHTIETAANGQEALTKFQAGHFDLVLTDRSMPEMNGDQLALAIKQLNPATLVVLLTGFGGMMNATGEKPPGVDLVLGKPISMVELQKSLTNLIAASAS